MTENSGQAYLAQEWKMYLLQRNQFANQTGKSTKTAVHKEATYTESAGNDMEIALVAFTDGERAFCRLSFEATMQATKRHGTETIICSKPCSILESHYQEQHSSGPHLGLQAEVHIINPAVKPGNGPFSLGTQEGWLL